MICRPSQLKGSPRRQANCVRRDKAGALSHKKALRFAEGFILNRATSYSPTHLRVQYHRG